MTNLFTYYREGFKIVNKAVPILLFTFLLATPLDEKLFGKTFVIIFSLPMVFFSLIFIFTPLVYYNAILNKENIPFNDMFKVSFKNIAKSFKFVLFSFAIFVPFMVLFLFFVYLYKFPSSFLSFTVLPLIFFLVYMPYIYVIMKKSLKQSFSHSIFYAMKNVQFSASQAVIIFILQVVFTLASTMKIGGYFNPYVLWIIALVTAYIEAVCEAAMLSYIHTHSVEKIET